MRLAVRAALCAATLAMLLSAAPADAQQSFTLQQAIALFAAYQATRMRNIH